MMALRDWLIEQVEQTFSQVSPVASSILIGLGVECALMGSIPVMVYRRVVGHIDPAEGTDWEGGDMVVPAVYTGVVMQLGLPIVLGGIVVLVSNTLMGGEDDVQSE